MLKEIRSDHRLFSRRIFLLALMSKGMVMFHGARLIFSVIAGVQFQVMSFALLIYMVSLDKFNELYMSPRIGHYLRLMQLGPDFKLTLDT